MAQITQSHAPHAASTACESTPRRTLRAPATAALITWALALPLCWQLPSWIDVDPFSPRSRSLALGAALGLTAVLLAIGWRCRSTALAGAGAGLFAAWTAL